MFIVMSTEEPYSEFTQLEGGFSSYERARACVEARLGERRFTIDQDTEPGAQDAAPPWTRYNADTEYYFIVAFDPATQLDVALTAEDAAVASEPSHYHIYWGAGAANEPRAMQACADRTEALALLAEQLDAGYPAVEVLELPDRACDCRFPALTQEKE